MPIFREPADEEAPDEAYPWNAVAVVDDSSATVLTPGNLREADRAYYNYSVMRMRVVRSEDPDVSCDSMLALEQKVVSSFVDGWIVARTLFGGPSFAPLDELAFARAAGLLRPLIAVRQDRHVGACAAQWAEANPGRVADYEEWRGQAFLPVESDPELADTESRDADDAEVGAGDSDSGATPEGGVRQPPPDEPAGARPPDTGNGRDRCLCASTTR
jgi:hypothetical protein